MKNVMIRKDLISKAEYCKKYDISRPTVDKRINEGLLKVERISNVDYIRV